MSIFDKIPPSKLSVADLWLIFECLVIIIAIGLGHIIFLGIGA